MSPFTSASADLGNWSWRPDSCDSGAREGFFGVRLVRDGQIWIEVIKDPIKGPAVRVFRLGDDKVGVLFEPAQCRTLELDVTEYSSMDSQKAAHGYKYRAGNVVMDCDAPGGGTVRGSAAFKDCS
jgi:hypothetical protein